MSKDIAISNSFVDIGVDVSHVYKVFFDSADSIALTGDHPFPNFDYLYEEYTDMLFQKKTKRDLKGVEQDMRYARNEVFDVEQGYRPEMYGISRRAEFLNALLVNNLVFEMTDEKTKEVKVINDPIVEVW